MALIITCTIIAFFTGYLMGRVPIKPVKPLCKATLSMGQRCLLEQDHTDLHTTFITRGYETQRFSWSDPTNGTTPVTIKAPQ